MGNPAEAAKTKILVASASSPEVLRRRPPVLWYAGAQLTARSD
jgi:hypothetical protein